MRDIVIVANWKANKTEDEALMWLTEFKKKCLEMLPELEKKEVIVCPSYPLVPLVASFIEENALPLKVGSQDISVFNKGAYTGEVPVSLLEKFIAFCIIGHSERRQNFNENDEMLSKKVSNAIAINILPIFCVQSQHTAIPKGVKIVAYEPIEAIGTGNPETPTDAEKIAATIKEKNKDVAYVLYGGSVTDQNVGDFTNMPNISGVLIGGASLDPLEFTKILQAC